MVGIQNPEGARIFIFYYIHPAYSLMALDILTVEGNS
jgi:hypothetical protein